MKLHSLAAILATLILAASSAIAGQPRTGKGTETPAVALPAEPAQPSSGADDELSDGPGNEGGFNGSWFPTVKPESEPNDLEENDSVLPTDPSEIPPVPLDAQYRVERGDTFKAVLLRAGVVPDEAERAIQALAKVYDPRRLQPGIEIFLQLQPQPQGKRGAPSLLSIDFVADAQTDVSVLRERDGSYTAKTYERTLTPRLAYGRATIKSSLYEAGQDAGISSIVLSNLVNLYSFDVDFQRDVQPGDSFEIVYRRMIDESGVPVRDGNIVLASMTLSGVTTTLYRFKTKSGYEDYFDSDGGSVQKSLLRTPTDAVRISSRFGRRKHPILGFTMMHRGIDFAAPAGTPVYAAGDGVIERAGWTGSYGKYIRIRHNSTYKTAYAHLRALAAGIAVGVHVKQRQVIGYVGATGRATGPHLHYEVIKNGRQINPQTIRLAAGYRLKGEELKTYKGHVEKLKAELTAFRDRMAHQDN